MNLASLLRHVPVVDVQGPLDREVGHVTRDTREVRADSIFVAIEGTRVDGHDLVSGIQPAAVVVQREVEPPPGATLVRVADTRRALAQLAAGLHGRPGERVKVVGITGTNGKTTVATLVEYALAAAGRRVARVGTTGASVDTVERPTRFTTPTTPEAPELQQFLADLRDEGIDTLAMEVTSIGLAQHRVDGIPFVLGVFTNLSQDHLEFHGTMDAYARAKSRLFRELLRPRGGAPRALLCGDDPAWLHMGAPDDRWLYGFAQGCDIHIRDARFSADGITLDLVTPQGEARLQSPMIGRHNAQNLAAAVGVCLLLGLGLEQSVHGVGQAPGVPGRLEVVPDPEGRLVVVDYAHSPDALQNALTTLREITPGRLWVVFGCGGDRDRGKRPQMGDVARQHADGVIVTSDNPRHEEPGAIIAEIVGPRGDLTVEVDRRAAIRRAIEATGRGDTVLIAGKGHETYQQIGDDTLPFDDRQVARELLERA